MKKEKTKQANVKLLFKGGKLDEIVFGDFGKIEKPDGPPVSIDSKQWEDCLLAWPVCPEFTGKSGIVSILNLPVTDRLFKNI